MNEQERKCCLVVDEMSITPSVEFDHSSGRILGDVTLPGHSGIATHGLVFMLTGKFITNANPNALPPLLAASYESYTSPSCM